MVSRALRRSRPILIQPQSRSTGPALPGKAAGPPCLEKQSLLGKGTFPCTAVGAPSFPPQCLSGPGQVHFIPSLIGFQGDMTGLPLGARITWSGLLITILLCSSEVARRDSALSFPQDIFTRSLLLVCFLYFQILSLKRSRSQAASTDAGGVGESLRHSQP